MLRGLVPQYLLTHGSLDTTVPPRFGTRIRVDKTVDPLIVYLSRVYDVLVIYGTAVLAISANLPSLYPVVPTVVLPRCHDCCFDCWVECMMSRHLVLLCPLPLGNCRCIRVDSAV